MSKTEHGAYSRGYSAASRRAWPENKPPLPPDDLCAGFIVAAQKLRDGVDSYLATLDRDDPLEAEFGPLIEAFDTAMARVTAWLREPPREE